MQALKKGEKQRVLGLLYCNIYRILKVKFIITLSIFVLLSTDNKAKKISSKVFKITELKNLHQEIIKDTLRP